METKFTWIPFYTELASKLLYYKSRRKELAKLIYSGFEKKEIKFLHDGDGSNFKELDPFTIYSVFNRSMKNRVLLAQKIKELFGLKSEVPSDFVGIPVQNPMMASYISFSENRSPDGKDVDRLWKLFEQAQDEKADISKVFNSVLKQYSIAIPKLTMGLYYISPNHFLALDGNNRDYLYHYGFEDWDFLDLQYSDYSELLELVREKMNKKIIKENSFPEFSANAYAGVENADSYSNMEEKKQLYIDLLKANNNLILTGAPGTGKTYLAKQIAQKMIFGEVKDQLTEKEQTQFNERCGFVQFHPSYDYTDFVEGLRPRNDGNGNVGFERKDGVFKEFCKEALLGRDKPFVFIIDEINRGEISKIFGELFFSIDPGYRGEKGMVQTQYQNMIEEGDIFKKGFYVPENVYIIGTMNDIDRSVESMDFAMRRRFAWKEVTAEESFEAMKGKMTDSEMVRQRMLALNDEIAKTSGLNKSYQIGAAYFLKLGEYGGDFDKLWEYHLKGLLYEYLRGNRDADEQLKKLESAYKGISESTGE